MTKVARSITILDTPERVWALISDFSRWDRLLQIPDARKKGWGTSFTVRSGAARGMQLAMLENGQLVQDWEVEEWEPGKRLRIASRKYYGRPAQAMRSNLDFGITSAGEGQTRVEIVFETCFVDKQWGWVFNLVPMKGEAARFLSRMEKGLLNALSGG